MGNNRSNLIFPHTLSSFVTCSKPLTTMQTPVSLSRFLKIMLLAIGFQALPANAIEFRSLPYLQHMTNSGVTILSVADKPCFSYVLYGETTTTDRKAVASRHGQLDAMMPVQKVRLTNLEPGKTYYYRVVSKEITTYQPYKIVFGDSVVSPLKSFTLPSANKRKFNFLAFNDVHSMPAFIDTVCRSHSDFDFVCYNGDMLDDITREDEIIAHFANPAARYFAGNKPFVFTRGNHETRGIGSRALDAYVDSPTGKYYYTFMWGNTIFLVIDTGEDKPDQHPVYAGLADYDNYRSEQAGFVKKVIASDEWKKAKHRIVCGHIPATHEPDDWHGPQDVAAKLVPLLNKAKVDMYICGHTHEAKIERPNAFHNYTLVVGGGPVRDKRPPGATFINVNVDGEKLAVELYKRNGDLIDTQVIK